MKTIFSSGSCRLLCLFDDSLIKHKVINSIHSVNLDCIGGINFCGKLHTARQHLFFLKYIVGDIDIEYNDKIQLFTMFLEKNKNIYLQFDPYYNFDNAILNIKKEIFKQKIFVFEICSLKNFINKENGIPIQMELLEPQYHANYLPKETSIVDCTNLVEYVNKKFNFPSIILVTHLRNWMFDENSPYIEEREIIFRTLMDIENKYNNVKVFDPSYYLHKIDLIDKYHYSLSGYNKVHYVLNDIINSFNNQ